MGVVATTLVREARSKSVEVVTTGESAWEVNRPMDFSATRRPRSVTATEAEGILRWAMASRRMEKAEEKILSCCSKASSRGDGEEEVIEDIMIWHRWYPTLEFLESG